MQTTVMFRDLPPNPSLQAAAERWVTRLEQVSDRLVGCHVSIEKPHRHRLQGALFQVNVVLVTPGAHIAVTNQLNQDAYVALADAFRAARRQLLAHTEVQRFVTAPAASCQVHFVANKQQA
jgi:ribosome-associated translation inhibitor RaiA